MSDVQRFRHDGIDGMACYENGAWVSHEDYAELKAERDALAAENAALKESVDHAAGCIHAAEVEGLEDALESNDGERLADLIHRRLCHAYLPVVTPATDAYLNSVRAEGVEMFAKHCDDNVSFVEPEDEEFYTLMEEAATSFAAQLRAGHGG